jgi:hypothetical protein
MSHGSPAIPLLLEFTQGKTSENKTKMCIDDHLAQPTRANTRTHHSECSLLSIEDFVKNFFWTSTKETRFFYFLFREKLV